MKTQLKIESLLTYTSSRKVLENIPIWHGMVWCGVVWCGVVWCGVVWCGVAWRGVAWYGMVWYGSKNIQLSFITPTLINRTLLKLT